jgi:hypothetical protein
VEITDVSDVLAASSIRTMMAMMMGVVSVFETSVDFCQPTRRNVPEDKSSSNSQP